MRRLICWLFLIINSLLAWGNVQPTIRSVSIKGMHALSERQLLIIVSQPGSVFSFRQLSQDLGTISNRYYTEGYYFADVHIDSLRYSDDSTGVDIEIGVQENKQVTIREIHLSGNNVIPDNEMLDLFDTKPGMFLVPSTLESDIEKVLELYEQTGYPFSKIDIVNIAPAASDDSAKLDIELFVDEGPKVILDDIKITGNTITKENVIIRETRLKLHKPFNNIEVRKIAGRLNRLNIFAKVEEPKVNTSPSGSGLFIKVEEGNTNSFDGILGYAPGTSSSDRGTLTGMVDISMRNLFGTARKLDVRWLRDERNSQEIGIQYIEPWLFDFPLNAAGNFSQRQQDTIYVRRGYNLKLDMLITESVSFGAAIFQDEVIPSGDTKLLSGSSTVSTGLDIRYDTRNDLLSPTGGVHYLTGYQIGSKRLPNRKVTIQRLSMDADLYVTTFRHQVAAFGVHGRSIAGDVLELGDMYRFGGTNTLRGYRESQFFGSKIAWTNAEYRFLLAHRSYFYGFFDTGYYFLRGDSIMNASSTRSFKYGYGIGIRLETAIGNVGVGFAFGEGDSFLQGKIHLGLINEF